MTTLAERTFSVPAGDLRALAGGRGPLILCLHGYGVTADMFRPTLPGLIAAGYSALAIDLPGHGGSYRPAHPLNITDLARVVDDLLTVLGLERISLIGNSLGGAVASEFALLHPKRVARLVLENAFALDETLALPFLRRRDFWRHMVWPTALESLSGRPLWGRPLPERLRMIFHRPERVPPGALVMDYGDGWMKNFAGRALVGLGVWWQLATRARRRAFVQRRAELRVPTLIVWGDDDRILPVANAYQAQALIPGARLRIFEQCGHAPSMEMPEEFNRVVVEFLAGETLSGETANGPGSAYPSLP